MITVKQKAIIRKSLKKYRPSIAGIFGSYARGEETADSDLDLLVEFENRVNLLDLIGLEQELSELLGVKVDLVTAGSVHKLLKPYIDQDFISVL